MALDERFGLAQPQRTNIIMTAAGRYYGGSPSCSALHQLSEPALGPLELSDDASLPDWIICGGETGRGARFMKPRWARGLRDQCEARGVAFFMKQMTNKARSFR